jgi:ketosteroid isomerase-like protein
VKHLMLGLIFVFAISVNAQEALAPPVAKELLPLEKARVDTLCKGDLPGLEKFFASDLTYVHSNGLQETGTEFLEKLRTGERKYVSMEHDPGIAVRSYGDVAILTGSSKVQVIVKGQTQNMHLRFTEVWQRHGKQWQVVAWHATKIAE